MFGGVVSLDGVPALGTLVNPNSTPATIQAAATSLRAYFNGMDAQRFAAGNAKNLAALITDPANVAKVAVSANKSVPRSVGEAIVEMLQTDLRPDMGRLAAPLLLIVPDGGAKTPTDLATLKSRYEAQVSAAPQHQVVIAPNSRHFIMLDAPTFFFDRLDEFLLRTVRHG